MSAMNLEHDAGVIPPPFGEGRKGGLRPPLLEITPMLCIGYGEAEAGVGVPRQCFQDLRHDLAVPPPDPAFGRATLLQGGGKRE
jgi:hypothetical protein